MNRDAHLGVGVGVDVDVWIGESGWSPKHIQPNLTDQIRSNKNKLSMNISLSDRIIDRVSDILH